MADNGNGNGALRSKGGRPRKPADEKLGVQIALRMDAALVGRLDRHMERLRQREPAVVWSRGSAIRALMLEALSLAEAVEQTDEAPNAPAPVTIAPSVVRPARSGAPTASWLRGDEVLVAVRELGGGTRALRVGDLRERFPTMARATLDASLLTLERRGFLELSPPADPRDARERDGAVADPMRGPLSWVKLRNGAPPQL